MSLDVWYHVAVTVPSVRSNAKLYIDGQDVTSGAQSFSTLNIVADPDVGIGWNAIDQSDYFIGLIDDVRIYDYALSDAEVMSIAGVAEVYYELTSVANVYDKEPENERIVNFLDYARLLDEWLDEELWP